MIWLLFVLLSLSSLSSQAPLPAGHNDYNLSSPGNNQHPYSQLSSHDNHHFAINFHHLTVNENRSNENSHHEQSFPSSSRGDLNDQRGLYSGPSRGETNRRIKRPSRVKIPPQENNFENMTLREIITSRPSRGKKGAAEPWDDAFDAHPDIQAISINQPAEDLEKEFRVIRGEHRDETMDRLMSNAIRRSLERRGKDKWYTDVLAKHWKMYLNKERRNELYERMRNPANEKDLELKEKWKKQDREGKRRRALVRKQGVESPLEAEKTSLLEELNEATFDPGLAVGEVETELER